MSYCLMPRPPSQMNLREQATPEQTVDAVVMVSVSIQAFADRETRSQRREQLAESHPTDRVTEPEPRSLPCPVICILFPSYLLSTPPSTPHSQPHHRPNARIQKQLLETASPDPHVVREGAGPKDRGGTLS